LRSLSEKQSHNVSLTLITWVPTREKSTGETVIEFAIERDIGSEVVGEVIVGITNEEAGPGSVCTIYILTEFKGTMRVG
jgi:hypothetical protein